MFVTVDKNQQFKSFISQTASIRLEYLSSNAEEWFVSHFKIVDHYILPQTMFWTVWWLLNHIEASIALCSFQLEMKDQMSTVNESSWVS